MKVYLASHYSRKNEVRLAVAELEAMGIDVVSTWHREKLASNAKMLPDKTRLWIKNSQADKRELDACTHFVLFSMGPTYKFSRGSHVWENGYAVAKGKHCLVVGERQVIFHYLPGTSVFKTWQRAKRFLKGELKHEHNTNFAGDRTITGLVPYPGKYLAFTGDAIFSIEPPVKTPRRVSRSADRSNPRSGVVPRVRHNPASGRTSGR